MTGRTIILKGEEELEEAIDMVVSAAKSGRLHLVYSRPVSTRTAHDNRAWWGLMQQIARESGTSAMHEHIRYAGEFLGWEFVPSPDGSFDFRTFTTTSLTHDEFLVLKQQVLADASMERGLILDPNATAGDPRVGGKW